MNRHTESFGEDSLASERPRGVPGVPDRSRRGSRPGRAHTLAAPAAWLVLLGGLSLLAAPLAAGAAEVSFGPQQVITTQASGAHSVHAADLDGDGDPDILSGSILDDKIAWYENLDGLGTFGPQQVITTQADGAVPAYAADLDGDGDPDVLSASGNDDKIAWYENLDGLGTFGPQQVITTQADRANSVYASDLDGDGDPDVLSASLDDDKIAWYENLDGLGTFGPQQVISTQGDGANNVYAADLDGDGDPDVLSASFYDSEIAWYENLDGLGTFGPQQLITRLAFGPSWVDAADLDGDGDPDVLSASHDSKIAWYENLDGLGTFGPQRVITTQAAQALSVHAADLDGDGDPDVLSASEIDAKIAWYENLDGLGTFGPQQVITTQALWATSVYAADLDGDGDPDVLSASYNDNKIAWYQNLSTSQTVTVAATDDSASEAGLTTGTFTFTRTGDSANIDQALTVTYTVAGTAAAGNDYVALGTAVIFPAGVLSVTKTLTPLDDALQELPETVILTLAPGRGYAVGTPGSATVTLASDEPITQTVTVRATDKTATELGRTTGTFTFSRTGSTTAALTVAYTVGGTATAGSDYAALGTTLTFPAGVLSVTKTLTPLDDTLPELPETVVVILAQDPSYAAGTPRRATVTLTSDDPITQTVTVAATDTTATEVGPTTGTFTFTRTGDTAAALIATYSVGGSAAPGRDYVGLGISVRFRAGMSTVTRTVTPLDDGLQELPETVVLTLAQGSSYAVGTPGSATVTLASDEPITQIVSVAASDASASEIGGTTGRFTFTRAGDTAAIAQALTVAYTLGGTATAGSDYVALGTSVRFPAGVLSVAKTLTPLDDALPELPETVVLTLAQGPGYAVDKPRRATVTLVSDDPIIQTVTVDATDAWATELGATTGTFTLRRTGDAAAIAQALTVTYSHRGTATAGSDYVRLGTSVNFPAGVRAVTKTVTPLDDTLQELPETIVLTPEQSPSYAVGTQSGATVTLASNEAVTQTVTVAATDDSASEAGLTTGTFTFGRTGNAAAIAQSLTVTYSVGGTATAGSDYVGLGTSVTFPAGAITVTKTLTPLDDTLPELPETVVLTLVQSPSYAVGAPRHGTVTLTSNDP